jgi:metal-responsive CopG/Arc/MetJ family transcriptional regulator
VTLRNMTPLLLALPPDLLATIDEHRYAERISSRQEAIRRLIRAGLEAAKRPGEPRKVSRARARGLV